MGTYIAPIGNLMAEYTRTTKCEKCGERAIYHDWDTMDGGCINPHWCSYCEHCGAQEASLFAEFEIENVENVVPHFEFWRRALENIEVYKFGLAFTNRGSLPF